MNIALLGFDLEGRASYDYFVACGDTVTICDHMPRGPVWLGRHTQLGDGYLDSLDRFDVLIRTPGLHPQKILDKNPGVLGKISSGTNEFFKACPTNNIIGVTGTKGKGTTSTMIAKLLEANGSTVHLGGNIGVPALSFLRDVGSDDWVVLELSSFQLQDLAYSPRIAVCLMIVPEHLNWHADMHEYLQAKSNLFAHQTPDDIAIYFAANDDSMQVAAVGGAEKIPFFMPPGAAVIDDRITIAGQDVLRTDELQLLGEHNWQNVCAAITAVWQAGLTDIQAMRSVLTTFTGLPHRLEFVRELDGIRYYNDSFSSGLHSTEAAVLAIDGPQVLVLGGYDRMLPLDHFTHFATQHTERFRIVLIIGQSGPRLAAALQAVGFDNFVLDETSDEMSDIVTKARSLTQSGDALLFSPGFASYDMFKNFEDRGDQFREAVRGL